MTTGVHGRALDFGARHGPGWKTVGRLVESGMAKPESTLVKVEVTPASREDEPVLANLLELYSHDFSEFTNLTIGVDGRFGYKRLPLYWKEPNRFPFLISANGQLAGFILVQQGSQVSGAAEVWDIAEFFVLRGYRRHGVGMRAAHDLWNRFVGSWEVRVSAENLTALAFWQSAVSGFTGRVAESVLIKVADKHGHVFSFVSNAAVVSED